MSHGEATARAVEWLEGQLAELTNIRNATARDPSFKNWRQATLTVMQRIWPGDQVRSERFRRIPFSPADPKADARTLREWYSRGCKEAARVLSSFVEEIRTQGAPDAGPPPVSDAPGREFDDGVPTVDLPAGDLGAAAGPTDMGVDIMAELAGDPSEGTDPSSPAPPRLPIPTVLATPAPAAPASASAAAPPPAAAVPPVQVAPPVPPPVPAEGATVSVQPRPVKKGSSVKKRLLDLLGFGHLATKPGADAAREADAPAAGDPPRSKSRGDLGVLPLGDDVGSAPALPPPALSEPAPRAPAWPILQKATEPGKAPPPPAEAPVPESDPATNPTVVMSKPTTLRTAIEKVSIESLIDPAFRGDDAGNAGAKGTPSPTPSGPAWPVPGAAANPAKTGAESRPSPPARPRPPIALVRPEFRDPEFSADPGPEQADAPGSKAPTAAVPAEPDASPPAEKRPGSRPSGARIVPLPTPRARVPAPESDETRVQGAERPPAAADVPASKADAEALARATDDFMRSSPVLGATGRKVQRGFDDAEFGDPDAIAVHSLLLELSRLGVSVERQPEVRARLLDLARRLERGDLEWGALRKAVWFVMEYPELARRVMPVLLPWIDRAA